MSVVNVLVVSRFRLGDGYLTDIAAVDPRISVKDGTEQLVAELRSAGAQGQSMDLLNEEVKLWRERRLPGAQESLDELLAQAEVIYSPLILPENLVPRAPRLKWIHLGATGVDQHLSTGIFQGNMAITNSRGVIAVPIAEHVLAFMIMLAKNSSRLLSDKQNRRWERFNTMELRDRIVGIIGLGAIGVEVARLAKGIGMKVIATRKSASRREPGVSGIDEVYPPSELLEMLSRTDFLVIAAPLTPQTRGLIGEAELRAMKPCAYLINIARGQIVDQSALISALKEGSIAGAGLDVVETEPLPRDSELWELPNVILSPHMAGSTDRRSQRVVGFFCENLRRYLSGEPMLNVIKKALKTP